MQPAIHRPLTVHLKRPYPQQAAFVRSPKPRRILRAGRRSGKTTGLVIAAVEAFLRGERVLYGVPTADQLAKWWHEVSLALVEPINAGIFHKNETLHSIELPGTEQRLRGKTCWNSDTLRGDYCQLLILDEYALMNEDTLGLVGLPMLLDRNGALILSFTPPSFRTAGITKAHDPRHAAKLFRQAEQDPTGRWAAFHFPSHANPYISRQALNEITQDMTQLAYRQEILAEDLDEIPGALWTLRLLDATRVLPTAVPAFLRVAVALDPAATSAATADEMGIVAGGIGTDGHGYVMHDASFRGTPETCARVAIGLYDALQADVLVGEANNGGEWIGTVLSLVAKDMQAKGERAAGTINYKLVHASRGKQTRAEPVSALYARHLIHHAGTFPVLEDQMSTWVPGMASPDHLDANVWLWTELLVTGGPTWAGTVPLTF